MTDEPEAADGIALLQAHLNEDEQAVDALLDMLDVRSLFAIVVGQLVELVGRECLQDALDDWRERRRL